MFGITADSKLIKKNDGIGKDKYTLGTQMLLNSVVNHKGNKFECHLSSINYTVK